MSTPRHPTVTVIIPALNAARRIGRLLDSLLQQEYPSDRIEVIVVDNGSTDETREIVSRYPVKLVQETRHRNPGSARNAGLAEVRSEIIAFIDADCLATPTWIAEAVRTLDAEGAALVGGNIRWLYSTPPQAAEIFDSLVHLRNDVHTRENGTAVTANLVVRSEVFGKTGPFPAWKAGEDYTFCLRARSAGYKIVFGPDVVVIHGTRQLRALLRKAWRVGKFHRHLSIVAGDSNRVFYKTVLSAYIPGHPKHIRRLIHSRGTPDMERRLYGVWIVSYLYNLVWGTAALLSSFKTTTVDPA